MSDPILDLRDFLNMAEGPVLVAAEGRHDSELASTPHQHARGQLFGSLRGLLSVGVDDGVWIVPAIHAVWLPPHTPHSGRSHGPFHGWSVYVAELACAKLPQHPCTLRTSGLLREAVLRACAWESVSALPLTESQAHVAAVILDEIRSLPVEPFGLPLPRDPRLQRVARALIADPADDGDLEHWAAWGAVSSRTLSRRFVTETGFNFTAWRQRARMMRSLEMLAAGMSVTAIALDLGYSTPSAFIGLFRRTFGDTPAAYRARL
ncbi:AraC family transcriptional regulator [Ottowia thiooxydans]|uniref:AraC-like DNA-binding protein n=1 Tax=Ottowia thiooxydans TaxID=219182 RepID=A0ABV2Q2G3_9BURK